MQTSERTSATGAATSAGASVTASVDADGGGPSSPYEEGALTLAEGAELLEQVGEDLAALNRLYADLIGKVGRLARGGVVEALEGMNLEHFAAVAYRMTGAELWFLEACARVLETMPATWCYFRRGWISWSQLRRIVAAARDLNRDDRGVLDRRIRASRDRLESLGANGLVEAVERAAEQLAGTRRAERAETRDQRSNFLSIQPRLFGGVKLYGEYDETAGAMIINALDAASDAPAKNTEPHERPTTRARQRAQGLVELSKAFLSGVNSSGQPRRARPLLVVHVPLDQVTATAAGQVELNLTGAGLPSLTARTVEALNTDADLRAVLFDGARPLAASDKISACAIPDETRVAVRARDRGCRWPGSRAPVGHTDIDHFATPRRAGGGHDPDGLVCFSRTPHGWREKHGWKVTLDPRTGQATFRRNGRVWRTLPWGTPLAADPGPQRPDPEGDGDGEGRDPPLPA